MPSPEPSTPAQGVRPRQCGRCRLFFAGDETLPPRAIPDWWLCPRCREALLGHGARVAGRPVERAQAVWLTALERAATASPDRFALGMLRAAHHDATTMSHALVLGRGQLAADPDDAAARRAVDALDRAVRFLGVRPEPNAAAVHGVAP